MECYCKECGSVSTTKVIDEGIGWYDWGDMRSKQELLTVVTDCCEGEAFSDKECTKVITTNNLEEGCKYD